MVGLVTHHIIDLDAMTHFSVTTGDTYKLDEMRVVEKQEKEKQAPVLQVQLDDEKWHCYAAGVLFAVLLCRAGRGLGCRVAVFDC